MATWRLQTLWGDEWSWGTVYTSRRLAEQAAKELRAEGWTVRVVREPS